MSEQEKPKVKNPPAMLLMHGIVIAIVIYFFWQILQAYLAGGPDAPTLTTVIISGVILLGGSCYVGYMAVCLFRQSMKDLKNIKKEPDGGDQQETEE